MLVLTRKTGESIHIGDGVVIKVLDVRSNRIRLGIDAPLSIRVRRQESVCQPDTQELVDTIPFAAPAGVC